jgi:tetratricopeptide (TPR) repeat protein
MKFVVPFVVLAIPAFAAAQDHAHAQGDRLGSVHFATSCNPKVAPAFDRSVALLHSFEFGAAIRGFTGVLAEDSTCAMAHWGIALARWTNPMAPGVRSATVIKTGGEAAAAAVRLSSNASERERGYVRAVTQLYESADSRSQPARVNAYERAMADLVVRQPADTEAKIFWAISLTAASAPTDKSYANQLKAGALLEELWVKQPDHPGLAHYIIHTYDYPPLADKARAAARRYADIAPSAAHAQHMPSHTFTRVGMWNESVEANMRSAEVATQSNALGEVLHAYDYAMYAHLQNGNEAEARKILDKLPPLAARYDPNVVAGAAPGSAGVYALAAIPARWVLERSAWGEAMSLTPRPSDYPYAEAVTYFARALGASHTGNISAARTAIDSLASIQKRLVAASEPYWAEQVAIQQLGAQAWLDLAEKREAAALDNMRKAAAREDATEKAAVMPGPVLPARELLGDLLLALGRRAEAVAEYQVTLKREPNRRHLVEGTARK